MRRQVGGIGAAGARCHPRVDLDQLAPVEDAHQRPVGAGVDPLADQVPRDRVERLGHLDVVIPVHLGLGVDG